MSEWLSEIEGDVDWIIDGQLATGKRLPREEGYLSIAQVLRTQSTCKRGKVGAVLVRDRRIIATGYNGSPPGMPHCIELGCDVDANDHTSGCRRTIHAEANVIYFAARHGVCTKGSTLYCTHGPCLKCAQAILAAGIICVVFQTPYRLPDGLNMLSESRCKAIQYGI